MDDDWDSPGESNAATSGFGVAAEGGKKFSAGRGFSAASNDDWDGNNGQSSNDWGNKQSGGDNEWADVDFGSSGNREHRGGGRGRGRGGRGRGGGRNNDRSGGDDSWGNGGGDGNEWGSNSNGDSGGRGRGGRGRGRGRGGDRGGGFGGRGDRGDRSGFGGDEEGGFGGGSFGNEGEKQENGEEKKREIYVPPERQTDEDLFTSTITSGVNFIKLDEIEVNVSGENVPAYINSFESSGLRPHLLENVERSGYSKPTPIQKYAIPIIMNNRDLMGCAQTGSGKTAAFLLPIIHKLMETKDPPVVEGSCAQPNVIIVTPTRELAIQIKDQATKFAYKSTVKVALTYGGAAVNHQRNIILSGCHILVATPGRLSDFVKRGVVSFASIQVVILDEADRMLDMGFLPNIEEFLGDPQMPATGERQTLMFSATFPEEIQELAGKFLNNYIFVAVGIVGSASTDVEQTFLRVGKFEKRDSLLKMLREAGNERTVVFVETKRNADFLATLLSESDIKTTSIHGDRLQREREQALWDFKKGIHNILVATGVAARGLDIEGIQHVVNYDLPKSIDEYVHRIGRTGRVGNRGKATSFFDSDSDSNLAPHLARILQQAGQEVPDFLSNQGYSRGGSDSFGGRDIRGDDFGRAQNFTTQPAEDAEDEW